MGKNTEIAWTDHTWNPWQGCHKVSQGCKNCYMFDHQNRWKKDPENIHRSAKGTFKKPLSWKDPAMVFTCSLSDFFIEEADNWRPEAWKIIRQTPHLTYQILTKRPERIKECLPKSWPLDNVWLGVTGEDQSSAMMRLRELGTIQAKVKFLSAEPLIGPIDLEPILHALRCHEGIDLDLAWVICGGESGSNARDMNPGWASWLLEDCQEMDIPFFMKQMSGVRPKAIPIPYHLNVREFPKYG